MMNKGSRQRLTVRMPAVLWRRVKKAADARGMDVNEFVQWTLETDVKLDEEADSDTARHDPEVH